jgi:hypothetical protein
VRTVIPKQHSHHAKTNFGLIHTISLCSACDAPEYAHHSARSAKLSVILPKTCPPSSRIRVRHAWARAFPPAEAEANYYRRQAQNTISTRLNLNQTASTKVGAVHGAARLLQKFICTMAYRRERAGSLTFGHLKCDLVSSCPTMDLSTQCVAHCLGAKGAEQGGPVNTSDTILKLASIKLATSRPILLRSLCNSTTRSFYEETEYIAN